jgi:hypothetical protein
LDNNNVPKVADFGMARQDGGGAAQTTMTAVGPVKWMAAEVLSLFLSFSLSLSLSFSLSLSLSSIL